jgi:hypothetical protein
MPKYDIDALATTGRSHGFVEVVMENGDRGEGTLRSVNSRWND